MSVDSLSDDEIERRLREWLDTKPIHVTPQSAAYAVSEDMAASLMQRVRVATILGRIAPGVAKPSRRPGGNKRKARH